MDQFISSNSNLQVDYPEEKTIHDYFLRKVEEFHAAGRKESLMDVQNEKIYSFSDYNQLSGQVAKSFWKKGLKKNDVVVFTTHDCGLFYFLLLGIWRANGIVRGVYSEEKIETIYSNIKELDSRWIICDFETGIKLRNLKTTSDNFEILVFGPEIPNGCSSIMELFQDHSEIEIPKNQMEIDDICLIMPTSGTTGMSKGTALTHKNMIYSCLIFDTLPMSGKISDPLLWFGKSTHISGAQFTLSILSTGQYTFRSNFSFNAFFETIQKYKIENLFIVTPLLQESLNHPLTNGADISCIKHLNCGATIMPNEFLKELIKKLPNLECVAMFYGMTECSLITSTLVPNHEHKRIIYNDDHTNTVSIGKLHHGSNLKIRDTETGQILGPNQKGELLFQSDLVFKEYYNNPEETKKSILEPGHWIATGDFGFYDENGFIYVEDRVKDTFKSLCSGNHVSPTDLENVILAHEKVAECIVIPYPYEQVGNPRAFVVLKSGIEPYEGLQNEIQEFANSKLADYKYLRGGVFIIPSLPRGSTGKVQRRNLANYQN